MPVTLCVLLWAREGCDAELVEYEDQVLQLVPEHGGRVIQRARSVLTGADPLEVHLLEFPSEPALQAYLDDDRRKLGQGDRPNRRVPCRARVNSECPSTGGEDGTPSAGRHVALHCLADTADDERLDATFVRGRGCGLGHRAIPVFAPVAKASSLRCGRGADLARSETAPRGRTFHISL